MMKIDHSVKIERDAMVAVRELLRQVPILEHVKIHDASPKDLPFDFEVEAYILGERHALICEVKSSGQPRHAKMAMQQLQAALRTRNDDALPVFVAPYLSPEVRAQCREADIGYLDFEGNAWLVFGGVFIDRQVPTKPAVERRELRSLFKPKSAQVLRAMLREPAKAWRVIDLAASAGVSLGHVSNVRARLLDQGWAEICPDGLRVHDPDGLLNAWRAAYAPPAGERVELYTTLHGKLLDRALRELFHGSESEDLALASFSAAQWMAPYARTGTQYFYVDEAGLERVYAGLALSETARGANVSVLVVDDPGIFLDTIRPVPDIVCTSPVQTYLDLSVAGERGQEAADHLRSEVLGWRR